MSKHTFKLKDTAKEYPARFGGQTVEYTRPDAVEGETVADALKRVRKDDSPLGKTLVNLLRVCDPKADAGAVIAGKFNGQGYDLDYQKEVKAFLGQEKDGKNVHADKDTAEVISALGAHMKDFRIGAPTTRVSRGSAKERAERAEAEAKQVKSSAVEMYRALSPEDRERFRPMLLANGTLTEQEAAEIDQAA